MSPAPFANDTNSQYNDRLPHSPDCGCQDCANQRFRARNPHLYGAGAPKPGMTISLRALVIAVLASIPIWGGLVYLAADAYAREGQIPKPILRPVGLYQAKRLCGNDTPKVECRAEIRRRIAALAWQKAARRHLERRLAALGTPVDHLAAWTCIHQHEGAWNANTGNGYHGGLQMDDSFMRTYGADMLDRYNGNAELWTPRDQMIVAERAFDAGRGFAPWPNTSRMCGLR